MKQDKCDNCKCVITGSIFEFIVDNLVSYFCHSCYEDKIGGEITMKNIYRDALVEEIKTLSSFLKEVNKDAKKAARELDYDDAQRLGNLSEAYAYTIENLKAALYQADYNGGRRAAVKKKKIKE